MGRSDEVIIIRLRDVVRITEPGFLDEPGVILYMRPPGHKPDRQNRLSLDKKDTPILTHACIFFRLKPRRPSAVQSYARRSGSPDLESIMRHWSLPASSICLRLPGPASLRGFPALLDFPPPSRYTARSRSFPFVPPSAPPPFTHERVAPTPSMKSAFAWHAGR